MISLFVFILLVETMFFVLCLAWLDRVTARLQEQEKILTKLVIALDKTNKKSQEID